MMRVRPATTTDAVFVTKNSHLSETVILRKASLGEVIVADMNGILIGFCLVEYLWSKVPYIGLIRVEENHRRQGCGRAMLQFLETTLRDRGHKKLYSSSQADEPAPQTWHRKMGFEECGIIAGINEEGIGEIFFRKDL
jgi:GNAT superfamily N-acetyltransferase